jgi:hypothetical protein
MTKSEALKILNCQDIDEVLDVYEERLFEFKAKVLQVVPPIKILKSIVKKIQRITEAASVFLNFDELKSQNSRGDLGNLIFESFLVHYQKQLSNIRLAISNTPNGYEVIGQINELNKLQQNLMFKLADFDFIKEAKLDDWPVKLSTPFKVYEIQVELKDNQLKETEISEYIRGQIESLDFDQFSELTLSVINAKKQIIFNELRREV